MQIIKNECKMAGFQFKPNAEEIKEEDAFLSFQDETKESMLGVYYHI